MQSGLDGQSDHIFSSGVTGAIKRASIVGGGAYASAGDYTGFKLFFSSGDVKSMIATLYGYNIS